MSYGGDAPWSMRRSSGAPAGFATAPKQRAGIGHHTHDDRQIILPTVHAGLDGLELPQVRAELLRALPAGSPSVETVFAEAA